MTQIKRLCIAYTSLILVPCWALVLYSAAAGIDYHDVVYIFGKLLLYGITPALLACSFYYAYSYWRNAVGRLSKVLAILKLLPVFAINGLLIYLEYGIIFFV